LFIYKGEHGDNWDGVRISRPDLEHFSNRRTRILRYFYWLALILALLKHGLYALHGQAPAYLLPMLLVVARDVCCDDGVLHKPEFSQVSSIVTTLKERSIRRWLEEFRHRWGFADLQVAVNEKDQVRLAILQFEEFMVDELKRLGTHHQP